MGAYYTCDGCGVRLKVGYGSPSIYPIDFKITTTDNDGSEDSERTTVYNFRLEEATFKWCFCTTNIHFCRSCILRALQGGIKNELQVLESYDPARILPPTESK